MEKSMINFSVPSDFTLESLKLFHKSNQTHPKHQISEVYGQVTECDFASSGRMGGSLPKVSFAELEDYIKQCNQYNINFNYTINPSCIIYTDSIINQIYEHAKRLYHIGVRSYTVTQPIIIEIIQSLSKDVNLKASAICEISSFKKATHYNKNAISRIVIDPDITKEFFKLRSICSEYASTTEIIINNMCVQDCPYKMFHYNHEAHSTGSTELKENRYFYEKCTLQKSLELDTYIKLNWIRPEDLHHYTALGIRYFKLQGRNHPAGDKVYKAINSYIQESFDGNLLDLLTLWNPYNLFQPYIDNKKLNGYLEPFINRDNFCSGKCDVCQHCMSYAKKAIDLSEYAETASYAQQSVGAVMRRFKQQKQS
jgi:collagenase-like PrtC family protease